MRKGDRLSFSRYCGGSEPYIHGMNWHAADQAGRMYRCTCMPSFRLPNGKMGPNGHPRKKAYTKNIKESFFGFAWRGRLTKNVTTNKIES